jgi:hypothetical protein
MIVALDGKARTYLDAFYSLNSAKTETEKILALQRRTGYTQTSATDTVGQLRALELALISDELS